MDISIVNHNSFNRKISMPDNNINDYYSDEIFQCEL
jgi:hypothetical protein